jgi:hypothetical protein
VAAGWTPPLGELATAIYTDYCNGSGAAMDFSGIVNLVRSGVKAAKKTTAARAKPAKPAKKAPAAKRKTAKKAVKKAAKKTPKTRRR